MTYRLISPPFTLKFREMPKAELRAYFSWYLEQIPSRLDALQYLVRESDGRDRWNADRTPASLIELGAWFTDAIEVCPANTNSQNHSLDEPFLPKIYTHSELTAKTFSIAVDIGMYISQVLISEIKSLQWTQNLQTKADIDYGQPVLGKFRTAAFNPSRMIITLAYGLRDGIRDKSDLRRLFDTWAGLAIY